MSQAAIKVAFMALPGILGVATHVNLAQTYVDMLDLELQPKSRNDEPDAKKFDARVFTDMKAALDFLNPEAGHGGTIVFLSNSRLSEAKELTAKHKDLKVRVFTNESEEPVVVQKGWVTSDALPKIVS